MIFYKFLFIIIFILAILFKCANKKCIFASWKCDGDGDCNDGLKSDEVNCSTTSKPYPVESTTSHPFITNVRTKTFFIQSIIIFFSVLMCFFIFTVRVHVVNGYSDAAMENVFLIGENVIK